MEVVEAIKSIDDVLNSDYHYDESLGYQLTSDDFEWLEKSKEALEKQIPKKYVDGRYPWATCPTCGGSINTEIVQEHIQNCETSYCEHCGQAIDWSETE